MEIENLRITGKRLKADGRGPLYKRHPKQLSAYTLSPKELAADT